ncbi:MAG: YkgJ family cysteine cluster protein [Candidatus Dadabacteria bacterium]|nr:YkgJ family cysteine cluster protein [Candidatus Dadabacteria bacterium]
MNTSTVLDRFRLIANLTEKEFDRNYNLYPGQMQCRKGCFLCCTQMFRITLIDAAVVSQAVKRLDPETRKNIQEKARFYLKKKEEMIQERIKQGDLDTESETPTIGLRLPCPALDENGACGIYESRPIVCRKFGMPIYDPNKPDELQTCELNFSEVKEIDADELIENQMKIYNHWMEFKTEVNETLNPEKRATTIAEAILFDYEDMLELDLPKPKPF